MMDIASVAAITVIAYLIGADLQGKHQGSG